MNKLVQVRTAAAKIAQLQAKLAQLAQLQAGFNANALVSDAYVAELTSLLAAIKEEQVQVQEACAAVNMQVEAIDAALQASTAMEQELLPKQSYVEAAEFFCSLTSDEQELQELLAEAAAGMEAEALYDLSLEALEEQYGHFVKFQLAYEAEDDFEKFNDVMGLRDKFAAKLLYALLNRGGSLYVLQHGQEQEGVKALCQEEQDSEPETKAEPEPAAAVEVEAQQDGAEEQDEAELVQAAAEEAEDDVAQTTAEEVQAELVQSTVAEVQPEANTAQQEIDEAQWEQEVNESSLFALNEQAPERVLLPADCGEAECFYDKENKKFSVKEFKKSFAGLNLIYVKYCFHYLNEMFYVNPSLLALLSDKPQAGYELICEKMLRMGYLRRYNVPECGSYYALSPKGFKVLISQSCQQMFGLNSSYFRHLDQHYMDKYFQAQPLNVALYLKSYYFLSRIARLQESRTSTAYVGKSSFYAIHNVDRQEKKCRLAYIGIFSDQEEDFKSYAKELQAGLEKAEIVVLMALSREHALGLAKWLQEQKLVSAEQLLLYCLPDSSEHLVLQNDAIASGGGVLLV